ncbi:hypothetical protein Droror1_Dr00009295 [Drosera rotundifolia]
MEPSHDITQIQETDALGHPNQALDIIDQATDSSPSIPSQTIDQHPDNDSQQYRHVQLYRRRGEEVAHSPALRDISPPAESTTIQPRSNGIGNRQLKPSGRDEEVVLLKEIGTLCQRPIDVVRNKHRKYFINTAEWKKHLGLVQGLVSERSRVQRKLHEYNVKVNFIAQTSLSPHYREAYPTSQREVINVLDHTEGPCRMLLRLLRKYQEYLSEIGNDRELLDLIQHLGDVFHKIRKLLADYGHELLYDDHDEDEGTAVRDTEAGRPSSPEASVGKGRHDTASE